MLKIKEISNLLPKNFQYFYIPPIFNQAIPLFLLPILTFYLSTDDYGVLAIVTSIVAILTPVLMMGSTTLMEIDYPETDSVKLKEKISTWVITPFLIIILFLLIVFLLENIILQAFQIKKIYLYFAFFISLLNILPRTLLIYLIVSQKVKLFVFIEITQLLINAIATLYFVASLYYGLDGRLYGISLALIFANIMAIVILYRNLSFLSFDLKEFKKLLVFGLGLLPHTVLSHFNRQIDRYFILIILGTNYAGLYYLGVQISSVLLEIFVAFNMAWSPFMMKRLRDKTKINHHYIVRSIYFVGTAFFLVFIIFQIFVTFIFPILIDEKFYNAKAFIFNLSLGNLFIGYYMLIVCIIFFSKKTYLLSILNISLTVIFLPIYYFVVKNFGAIGASYVYLLYCIFMFLATLALTNKLYPLPWIKFNHDIIK